MARTVTEWIGKTDDQRAPNRVRDRILAACPNCHICTRKIEATERHALDHVVALINGGENRESNLRPVHIKCHAEKTAADVAEKARIAAKRQAHIGIKTVPVVKIKSAPFPQSERAAARQPKPQLPPRQMFQEQP